MKGNVCFAQTAPLTIDGTIISNLDEFAALRTAFATFSELNDVDENFGIDSKEWMIKEICSNHNWTYNGYTNICTFEFMM